MAAVKALQFPVDMGFRRIILEGDCSSVMGRLSAYEADLSAVGMILEEAKNMIGLFVSCVFSHTLREGNRAAHATAQLGVSQRSDVIWVEDYHASILSIIIDVNSAS
ncbi:hypothetical protein PTKIN_Ptkin03bG0196900 [Pterospermum kingtungense]